MFGIKFRSWMETHIVRPRKKRNKEGTSKSPGKNDKILTELPTNNSTLVGKTTTKDQQAFCLTVNSGVSSRGSCSSVDPLTTLNGSQDGHSHGTGNNLSSPESAYSTGYSTDGTSPGHPPEYYINIRTGMHYFLPTTNLTNPTSAAEVCSGASAVSTKIQNNVLSTFTSGPHTHYSPPVARVTFQGKPNQNAINQRHHFANNEQSFDLTCTKQPIVANGSSKASEFSHCHRRTESCGENWQTDVVSLPLPSVTASPRQRTRIRTNPWLTSNTPTIPWKPEVLTQHEQDPVSSSTSSMATSNMSDFTDDDVTLNEMMGKFDESYVYEKETDILSDSDPTDCDETDFETGRDGGDERDTQDEEELDFIDNGSLIDLQVGADSDKQANIINKGHCTYHDFLKKPRFKESMRRRSSARSKEDNHSPILRRSSCNKEPVLKRKSFRDGSRSRKHEGNEEESCKNTIAGRCSEKRRVRNSVRKNVKDKLHQSKILVENNLSPVPDRIKFEEIESGGGLNFNRILLQRRFGHGDVIGTRSAGSTPVSLRKKVLTSQIESPKKIPFSHSNATSSRNTDVETDDDFPKRRSNSVSYARNIIVNTASNQHITTHLSELALIEADKEADLKYKQLILEAENILTTMKDQILPNKTTTVIPKPKIFSRKPALKINPELFQGEVKICQKELFDKNETTPSGASRYSSMSPVRNISLLKENFQPHRAIATEKEAPRNVDSGVSMAPSEDSFKERIILLASPLRERKQHNSPTKTLTGITSYQVVDTCLQSELRQKLENRSILTQTVKTVKNISKFKSEIEVSDSDEALPNKLKVSTLDNFQNNNQKSVEIERVYQKPHFDRAKKDKLCRQTDKMKCTEMKNDFEQQELFIRRGSQIHLVETNKEAAVPVTSPPFKMVKSPTLVFLPRQPLVAFRSVDLGNELDDSNYCPQSEPVKRKVYSCSASYDKLQKSLAEKRDTKSLNKQELTQDTKSKNILREKLQQLRERDEKERRLSGTLSPDLGNQRQLTLFRRQMLVNTIEGLKRSLEDQSARLKATYCSEELNVPKQNNLSKS